MKETVRVATASVESRAGESARNLSLIGERCREAARAGVELVVFPELAISGFIPNHPVGDHAAWLRQALAGVRRVAERVPGRSTAGLVEIARANGLYVAAGLVEDAGNVVYNTVVLAGPEGVAGCWRKMHIPMFEMPLFSGGPAVEVVETELGRVGVNICFDALLPESTRLLAVKNVEVVLVPFAADPAPGTAAAWADWAGGALRARCVENGVFGVAVNYRGRVEFAGVEQSFPGGAMVVGPRGDLLAEQREPEDCAEMLVAELRAEQLAAARAEPEYLFRFRRPELYGPLA